MNSRPYIRENRSTSLALSDISEPTQRLRELRPETIDALAESMAKQGLLHPLLVRPWHRAYLLMAGRHRLEAAKKLNWRTIECVIKSKMSAVDAELAEIDENLIRAELSPAERALHIAKRKALYERLHPNTVSVTRRGGPGRGKKNDRQTGERFTKATAKNTGQSERKVQRDATRAKKVKVLGDVIGTSLDKGDELDALAKLSEAEQRQLATRAKSGETVTAKAGGKAREREPATATATTADPMSGVEAAAAGDMSLEQARNLYIAVIEREVEANRLKRPSELYLLCKKLIRSRDETEDLLAFVGRYVGVVVDPASRRPHINEEHRAAVVAALTARRGRASRD